MISLRAGLSWIRFHRARRMEWRATATLLKAIRLARKAEALRQREIGYWGLTSVPSTWRPPSAGHRLDRSQKRATEAFGDGTRPLGTIITKELGHQAYAIGLGFVGNFDTIHTARTALIQLADCRPQRTE